MRELEALYELVKLLRRECPWDREQTFESMVPNVEAEARECSGAVAKADWANLREEIGDTMFNLLFLCNLAEEKGHFTLAGALEGVREKMIRRHPHVFGEVRASTPEEALQAFLEAKKREGKGP